MTWRLLALISVVALAGCMRSSPVTSPGGQSGSTGATQPSAVVKTGYIPLADGTKLAYAVALPATTGRFPVALAYAGYCEGANPYCNDSTNAHALVAAGYAVLGVSIRGTGCSTGTFDVFTPQEWSDGAAAVEWAAQQAWSNGHVGLFGDSFPGITQLGVAALRPPHLDAIAPFQVTTDLYRDVSYPGGILNVLFGAFWAGIDQPEAAYTSGLEQAVGAGDTGCAESLALDLANEPLTNIGVTALQHPFDDVFWQTRAPGANVMMIDVPAFGCLTWQDDEVSSRPFAYLSQLDPARTWFVASNGYHGMCEISAPAITSELVSFFDRYVKGKSNGFESTPHIQIWHDATANGQGEDVPSWITRYDSYSAINPRPLSLYLQSGGSLSINPPTDAQQPTSYVYPLLDPGNENGDVFGQHNILWQAGEPPGGAIAYTTPPLTQAAEFTGSGSANLWLSSTAPDTDLQITLTEVRPDGQEVYIARGWLRASHRKLDDANSTALAPYHTDQQADALMLEPGTPTYLRVQLWPFDYVFRKGSSIRLWIDAPLSVTGGWSLALLPIPAVNSIYADAEHPSALVLGHVGIAGAEPPQSTCNTLINQPCRQNMAAVPTGTMTIPAD